MKTLYLGAVLLLAGSSAAHAVSYTTLPGAPDPGPAAGESIIVDFEGPVAGVTYGGSYTIDTALVPGFRAPPAGDLTNYFAVPGVDDPVPNTATIDFTAYVAQHGALRSISFYWGSTDSYNTLDVLGSSGTLLTLTGDDINAPANGDQSDPATNRRVFFTFDPGDNFTGFRFTSDQRAFEIDDIAGAVPEPTTWATLIAGLGFVGLAMRRRRSPGSVAA